MKKTFLLIAATLIAVLSLSVFADETSAPVPIHRTTAKHRVVRPARKPAAVRPRPAAVPAAKAAASGAK